MELTGVERIWVADITYIQLHTEFVYLALIPDRYSRKAVGWNTDRLLTGRLATGALEQAIESGKPSPGLVHHSDRRLQYASAESVAILKEREMIPGMSRPGNPYDNVSRESFIKTPKREEIYANEHHNLEHLQNHTEDFTVRYYNKKRLHSAPGYCAPESLKKCQPGI
jgi:putative transposase